MTTAIRRPKRGKAHRPRVMQAEMQAPSREWGTICGYGPGETVAAMTERLPVDQVAPEDLCRRCWPERAK